MTETVEYSSGVQNDSLIKDVLINDTFEGI
jgi:hypothetical protein